jgi:methionyl-tRNA formyltransferase
MTPTPVGQWAAALGVPLYKEENVNRPEFLETLRGFTPDAAVVIAFGQKLSPEVIGLSGRLVVNLHASLLPRFRGAAPINHAIIQGDKQTGVSVISLAQRMDAGLIYATSAVDIDQMETAGELHDRLAMLGPAAVGSVLQAFENGTLKGHPQDESKATRAPKFTKEDGAIGFDKPAQEVCRKIHGITPWPGARAMLQCAGKPAPVMVILHRAKVESGQPPADMPPGTFVAPGVVSCSEGLLRIVNIQTPGGKVLDLKDFLNGNPIARGDKLLRADHQ